jgi:hypothetical protein
MGFVKVSLEDHSVMRVATDFDLEQLDGPSCGVERRSEGDEGRGLWEIWGHIGLLYIHDGITVYPHLTHRLSNPYEPCVPSLYRSGPLRTFAQTLSYPLHL